MNLWKRWRGTLISFVSLIFYVTSAVAAADPAPTADARATCAQGDCVNQRQPNTAGLVLGAAAVETAAVTYPGGLQAAMAMARGFLLSSHFLFDTVPLAIGGAAVWFYGPQVWEWLGLKHSQEVPSSST